MPATSSLAASSPGRSTEEQASSPSMLLGTKFDAKRRKQAADIIQRSNKRMREDKKEEEEEEEKEKPFSFGPTRTETADVHDKRLFRRRASTPLPADR